MPAAPDPPGWKETGCGPGPGGAWQRQRPGGGAEDGQKDPCALSSAPPARLPTQPPSVRRGAFSAAGSRATGEEGGRPRRLRGAVPLLPASRPPLSTPPPLLRASTAFPDCPAASPRSLSSSSRAPAQLGSPRTEALGAPRTRGTPAAPGQPPAGAPLAPPAPRGPRSPPPRLCPQGAGPRVQPQTRRGSLGTRQPGSGSTMEEPQRARSHTVTTTASSFAENFSTSSSSFAYDREFLRTLPGLLIVAEIVSADGPGVAGGSAGPRRVLPPCFSGWSLLRSSRGL